MYKNSVDYDPNGFIKGLDHKLLTPEQEKILSQHVRRWLEWEEGPDKAPSVIKDIGIKSRNILIESNRRLVQQIVRRYNFRSYNIDMETTDLFQQGLIGLIKAAEKFDYRKNIRFSTFAFFWIRQSINRALHSGRGLVKVPVHLSEKITKVKRFSASFAKLNKRQPTKEEIMININISEKELDRLNKYHSFQCHTSFECIKRYANIGVLDEDTSLLECFKPSEDSITLGTADQNVTISQLVEKENKQAYKNKINIFLKHLSPDQKIVVTHTYGLFDKEIYKAEEIAKILNEINGVDYYDKKEVKSIQTSALAKLRRLVKEAKKKAV